MKVYLIGAGPGDPGLLTLKAKDAISRSEVLIYDYLAAEALLAFAPADAERIYVGKKGGDHTLAQDKINQLIVSKAKEGKTVGRLKGGDPYMFGRGGEEAEELHKAGIAFEVIPGITSGIAGPAYAGIPVTHRGYSSSVCFITGHEDPTKPDTAHNWEALAKGAQTLVFYMGMKNLPEISRKLIEAGLSKETPAALVRWGTTSKQRSLFSNLALLPEVALAEGFSAPCIIIVGDVVSLHNQLNWFEKKPLFGKTIVVTRAREQASESAHELEELGARVIQFPTIKIEDLPDYSKVQATIKRLPEYEFIIFTSANGVDHFWKQLEFSGLDARAFASLQIAAIGPATAKKLLDKGLRADFIPEKFVAESVAEGLITFCGADIKGMRFLLPRAFEARDVLPESLEAAGALVDVLPVYKTVPSYAGHDEFIQLLHNDEIDCITFGSSSTVTNFLNQISTDELKKYPKLLYACIGPITASTLKAAGLDPHIEPSKFTIPALIEAVVQKIGTI